MKGTLYNPYGLIRPHQRPSVTAWRQFGLTLLLALGTGLFLTGIIFFFAHNWSGLHHLAKFGILAAGIAGSSIASLFCRRYPLAQQMLLLVASVLVGVLLAVFGQAYQLKSNTGFIAWALFILLWAVAADFHVLWLLFIAVLHIGIFVISPTYDFTCWLLTYFSSIVTLLLFALLPQYVSVLPTRPRWFVKVLFVAASLFTCACLIFSLFDGYPLSNPLFLFFFPALAAFYGFQQRDITIVSLVYLVLVVELSALCIRVFSAGGFFFVALTVLLSIIIYVYIVKELTDKWNTSTPKTDPDEEPE